jgi:hypothetical protein
LFSVFSCAALPAQTFTTWTGSVGNWHDNANWDAGIPDLNAYATVNQGEAQFSTPTEVGELVVGYFDVSHPSGSVSGSADLTIQTGVRVGFGGAYGTGNTETATGKLVLQNGSLNILGGFDDLGDPTGSLAVGDSGGTGSNNSFTAMGTVDIQNGSLIAPFYVRVGSASGTGTNNTLIGTGIVNVSGGNLTTNLLQVGMAGGVSAQGSANGSVSVTDGNIIIKETTPDPYSDFSQAYIGQFSGTSAAQGTGTGSLTLTRGDFEADYLWIAAGGSTSSQPASQMKAKGTFTVYDGNVSVGNFNLGYVERGTVGVEGLFQQFGGITTADNLNLGVGSSIVLGIGGPMLGTDYSQIQVGDALLNGVFEARFVDGYSPLPGDVFDLVVAGNIAGSYSLQITGINPADYQNLVITQTNSLIRLSFLVPEPDVALLFFFGLMAASKIRRMP